MALAEMIDQTRTALTASPEAGAATLRTTSPLVGVTEVACPLGCAAPHRRSATPSCTQPWRSAALSRTCPPA